MPAGLSSSTLNLKFMQRAAARTPTTSAPSTPAPAASASASSSSKNAKPESTPTPAAAVASTPETSSAPLIASEEPYRWKLDRPAARKAEPALLIPRSSGVTFESSYLPFMDHEDVVGPGERNEAGPSRQGGGGRMTFGYTEPEQEDLEKDDEAAGAAGVGEDVDNDVVINVRDREKEVKKDRQQQRRNEAAASRKTGLFQRPRSRSRSASPHRTASGSMTKPKSSLLPPPASSNVGKAPRSNGIPSSSTSASASSRSAFPPVPRRIDDPGHDHDSDIEVLEVKPKPKPSADPSSSASAGKRKEDKKSRKRKQSQDLNATIATTTKGTATAAQGGDKKPRLEPSLIHDHSQQSTPASTANTSRTASPGGATLDEREQALKAQRKKEKMARKKAKRPVPVRLPSCRDKSLCE